MYTAEYLETRPFEAFEAAFINLPQRHGVLHRRRDLTEPLGLATPTAPSSVSMTGVFGRKNAYVTWRNPDDAFVPMIVSVLFLAFTFGKLFYSAGCIPCFPHCNLPFVKFYGIEIEFATCTAYDSTSWPLCAAHFF